MPTCQEVRELILEARVARQLVLGQKSAALHASLQNRQKIYMPRYK